MKASSVLVSRVKEIVAINGEVKLNNPVTISYQRYIGYNYTTKQHEYVPTTVQIREAKLDLVRALITGDLLN